MNSINAMHIRTNSPYPPDSFQAIHTLCMLWCTFRLPYIRLIWICSKLVNYAIIWRRMKWLLILFGLHFHSLHSVCNNIQLNIGDVVCSFFWIETKFNNIFIFEYTLLASNGLFLLASSEKFIMRSGNFAMARVSYFIGHF